MKKLHFFLVIFLLSGGLKLAAQSNFIGQIMIVPYNFAPRDWHDCDGALLPIAENDALFSLIGTTYGGDGQTTFALPNISGRVIIDDGQGNTLQSYTLGQTGGVENVQLTVSQLPQHNHNVNAVTAEGNNNIPTGKIPANTKVLDKEYSSQSANSTMKPGIISATGGSQPHPNLQPYVTLKCVIALTGIYPTQN